MGSRAARGAGKALNQELSVGLGDQVDMVFDHLEANDGVCIRADDRRALRKTGCGARRDGLEANVRAGRSSA